MCMIRIEGEAFAYFSSYASLFRITQFIDGLSNNDMFSLLVW